ncbi:unnamed protein product [Agarophyton chilense]
MPLACQSRLGKRVGSSSHSSNTRSERFNSNPVQTPDPEEVSHAIASSTPILAHTPTNSVHSPPAAAVVTAVKTLTSVEDRLNPGSVIQMIK